MSVAQRNDGRWCVKYKPEGSKTWRQRTFAREEDALAFDEECHSDQPENSRITVLEAILIYIKSKNLSPVTIDCFKFLVYGHDRKDGKHTEGPLEMLNNKYVDTLRGKDLWDMRDACLQRGTSPAMINMFVARTKAAFNFCAREDLLEKNPWSKYTALPTTPRSMSGSLEDYAKIYACLPEWMQWACRTAMCLCLRPGMVELFSLKWSAFHWSTKSVTVWMGKVKAPKTVYAPDEYLAEAAERWQAAGRDDEAFVCLNRKGRQVTYQQYSQAWYGACTKAGVKMAMYAIRHIVASQMLAAGADLAAVAAQLGHRDITTTGRYYAHALSGAQKRAAEALPLPELVRLGAAFKKKNE